MALHCLTTTIAAPLPLEYWAIMRLEFVLFLPAVRIFGALLLFLDPVSGAGSGTKTDEASTSSTGTTSRREDPLLIFQRPPLPPISDHEDLYVPSQGRTYIPVEVTPAVITSDEKYRGILRLAHRLIEMDRDGTSLQVVAPPVTSSSRHLTDMSQRLLMSQHAKQVVFLDVSPDRRGRLVAVPYRLSEGVPPGRLSWAILQVHPASRGTPPRIDFHSYVSHFEPDLYDLDRKLFKSLDVQSLHYFLTRRV
ncbi:hypothetical protein PHSY_005529 [Pseudozyma hubeiensis SY62]|uniref:Uncharacterized protein n=1 Tax=Pseudozyma hubeiensis (strain SY62) TaxID=1305764 RepID=R9P9A1_PSEHS|nr:hypothetical protein PHSY_005529 [Pseudozyma hubeiensis SY62]GAC97941.1 hypothetical protein PHSY_005529 [Pseudozyma hubeiensis SY62]